MPKKNSNDYNKDLEMEIHPVIKAHTQTRSACSMPEYIEEHT